MEHLSAVLVSYTHSTLLGTWRCTGQPDERWLPYQSLRHALGEGEGNATAEHEVEYNNATRCCDR